jgi:hypothetical protein
MKLKINKSGGFMKQSLILLSALMLTVMSCDRMGPTQNRQEEEEKTPQNINQDIRDSEIESYQQRQSQGQREGQQRAGAGER